MGFKGSISYSEIMEIEFDIIEELGKRASNYYREMNKK